MSILESVWLALFPFQNASIVLQKYCHFIQENINAFRLPRRLSGRLISFNEIISLNGCGTQLRWREESSTLKPAESPIPNPATFWPPSMLEFFLFSGLEGP